MLQSEIAPVTQQAQKVAGIFSASNEKDFLNSRIYKSLDGVIHLSLIHI